MEVVDQTCGCGGCDFFVGTCPREERGELERRRDLGGPSDFLCGRRVSAGTLLHMLTGDVEGGRGRWVEVRYEIRHVRPGRIVELVAQVFDGETQKDNKPGTVFRWPPPCPTCGGTGRRRIAAIPVPCIDCEAPEQEGEGES